MNNKSGWIFESREDVPAPAWVLKVREEILVKCAVRLFLQELREGGEKPDLADLVDGCDGSPVPGVATVSPRRGGKPGRKAG